MGFSNGRDARKNLKVRKVVRYGTLQTNLHPIEVLFRQSRIGAYHKRLWHFRAARSIHGGFPGDRHAHFKLA